MKKIYSYITIAVITFFAFSLNAGAQPKGFEFSKQAVKTDNGYNLVIEAFEKGKSNLVAEPVDIVLILDASNSVKNDGLLPALKTAAKTFINTVYDNSPGDKYHNIAVITFYSTVNSLTTAGELVPLNQTLKNNLTKNSGLIDNITTGNNTYSDAAFTQASTILKKYVNDERKKFVVFFTDGVPCDDGDNSFNCSRATNAINTSYELKTTAGINATVYSIAILNSETSYIKGRDYPGGNRRAKGTTKLTNENRNNYSLDARRFLNYLSSNYSFKIGTGAKISGTFNGSTVYDEQGAYRYTQNYPNMGGDEQASKYYQLVDQAHASQLEAIFRNIASEATQGGAAYKFDVATTSVKDMILTGDFKLPYDENTQNFSAIKVEQIECTNITVSATRDTNYVWATSGTSIKTSDILTVDGNNITVKNYDFSKNDEYNGDYSAITTEGNWVGFRTKKDGTSHFDNMYGRKLRITIPIKLDDDYNGGYGIYTNTEKSGVYEGTNFYPFTNPTIDLPTIAIAKKGLANGESAVFKVAEKNGQTYQVILTGATGKTWSVAILKGLPYGEYTVSEDSWSWTYDASKSSVTEYKFKLNDVKTNPSLSPISNTTPSGLGLAGDGDYSTYGITKPNGKYLILPFENTKADRGIKNAEDVENNDFRTSHTHVSASK